MPTPEPTPTPDSAAVPEATSTPSTVQPEVTLESLVVTDETTGKELMDRISEAETACVKEAFGGFIYEVYLNIPIMQQSGLADSDQAQSMAASMFGCLTSLNAVFLGVAFADYQAGGFVPPSRTCIVEASNEYPDMVFDILGISGIRGDSGATSKSPPYLVPLYSCLTDKEKVELLARNQGASDGLTAIGDHVIPTLSESEQSCVRSAYSDSEYTALLGATVMEALTPGSDLSNCVDEGNYVPIFLAVTELQAGGLTGESRTCLTGFGESNPEYVSLVGAGAYEVSSLSDQQIGAFAQNGLSILECLTDDELLNMQVLVAQGLSRS